MRVTDRISPSGTSSNGVFDSVDDLAAYLRISRAKAYQGLNDGVIPAIRLGKRFIIPRVAIENWLEQAAGGRLSA